MSLALRLGRTLGELGSMSSQEFSLWLAYYPESPWDDARSDLNAGIIASTVANYAGRMRKDGADWLQANDFLLFKPAPEEISDPDPVAFFTAVAKTTQ